jgi:hypothetical protein
MLAVSRAQVKDWPGLDLAALYRHMVFNAAIDNVDEIVAATRTETLSR